MRVKKDYWIVVWRENMAVSKKLKAIYMGFFDGIETWTANRITDFQERRDLNRYITKEPIPKEYAKAYRQYWRKYGHFSPKWGWYYASQNGIMDVRYVPHTIFYGKLDQYFNARKLGYGFNDKNYYSKIFAGIKQPETVVRVFGKGYYTNSDYQQISLEEAVNLILENDEVICKPSQESGSGRSILFWKTKDDKDKIKSFLKSPDGAYIVQKIIKQHKDLNAVHAGSINSLRIVSILLEDGVHILSSNLRMGVDKARIDNVTAGGISVGICPDGTMKECAYNYFTGEKYPVHPQGFVFKGATVPSYDKAVELVKTAHQIIGHFRLVSWDIAIDEVGDAVLIEANMRKGGINLNQFSNGPLFGDLTDKVMNEVFKR